MLEEACEVGDRSWCDVVVESSLFFVGGREFDRANSGARRERKLSVQKGVAFCVE